MNKTKLIDFYIAIDFHEPYLGEEFFYKLEFSILSSIRELRTSREFSNSLLNRDLDCYALSEEGSLKNWLVGVGAALYIGIGEYGDFRSGLNQLAEDADMLRNVTRKEILRNTNTDIDNVLQMQDNGVINSITVIYNELDWLERNYFNISPNEMQQKIKSIKNKINVVMPNMSTQDQNLFAKNLPQNFINTLPYNFPKPVNTDERLKYFATLNNGSFIRPNRRKKRN